MEDQPINRLGSCPHCKENWDNGDIYESLSKMSIHILKKPEEVEALARQYGWTKENPTRFSKTNTIELEFPLMKVVLYECTKCNYVYEALNGKEYKTLAIAKHTMLRDDEPEEEMADTLDDSEG